MNDPTPKTDPMELELLLLRAGELPADRASALKARLATDAALQSKLEQLDTAERQAFDAVGRLDQFSSAALEGVAHRNAVRAMRQWHLERTVRQSRAGAPDRQSTTRWWIYPAGIAAAVLVGMIVWWGNVDPNRFGEPMTEGLVSNDDRMTYRPSGRRASEEVEAHAFAVSLTTDTIDALDDELNELTYLREMVR
ncbi:MAG TPA: hypothetical protein PKB10_14850 [Tepidisphaeraceae bacterium]|nr:hypothetical protein [Tepidisphaeraceae bacterium]